MILDSETMLYYLHGLNSALFPSKSRINISIEKLAECLHMNSVLFLSQSSVNISIEKLAECLQITSKCVIQKRKVGMRKQICEVV